MDIKLELIIANKTRIAAQSCTQIATVEFCILDHNNPVKYGSKYTER